MRRARGTLFNVYVAVWLGRRVLRLRRGRGPWSGSKKGR
jgi:hypothetical protein